MAPSIKLIPHNRLHVSEPNPNLFGNGPNEPSDPSWTNENWLKSRFHFSFAEYSNPANSQFGVMRVMNDDLVQPHRGFGAHQHRDMEIITYVVHGELTHKDSMGNMESLGRGSIQFMTAGTGITHSEFNDNNKPLRFIQTWIIPTQRGLTVNYGSSKGESKRNPNQLQHLVSSANNFSVSTPVELNQDVDMFVSELELGAKLEFELQNDRQAYLLCIEGILAINGKSVHKYDACEITNGPGVLEIEGTGTEDTENGMVAHFVLFTMKAVANSGRSDISSVS